VAVSAAAAEGRESIADVFLPSVCPRSNRVWGGGSSLPTATSFALMEKQRALTGLTDFIANGNTIPLERRFSK